MANLLVQSYRKDNPDTPLSDDQISIRFAEENAVQLQEIFKADPSYKSDMDRIWGVTETADVPADGGISGWDTTKQVYTQFMKGLAEQNILTTGPETVAIGTSALGHALDLPEEGFWNAPRDPKETATGAFAEFIKTDVHEFVTPEISEKKQGQMRNDFWRTTIPHGLGSGAGFILSGGFIAKALQGGINKLAKETGKKVVKDIEKKALKRGMKAEAARKFAVEQGNKAAQKTFQRAALRSNFKVTAGLGAVANGPQGYKDAVASGATPGEAFQAWMLNMGVGTSEVLPMRKFIGRISGIDKYIGNGLKEALVNAGWEAAEEAAQEFFQGAAGNVIAKWMVKYDPDREILADWKENAAAGGVTGAILSLATTAIGGRVRNITGEAGETAAPETDELLPDTPTIVARAYEGENKEAIVALAEREAREGYTREVEDEYYKLVGMGEKQDTLARELYNKTKNQALARNAADDAVAEAEAQIDEIADTAEPTEQEQALLAEAEEVKGSPLTSSEIVNILAGNAATTRLDEDEDEANRREEFFKEEEARAGQTEVDREVAMQEASIADEERVQQEELEAIDAAGETDRKNKAQTAATAQKNEDLSAWRAAREKQQAEAQPATEEVTPETEENLRQQLQEEQEDITEGTGTVNGQEIAKIAVDAVDNEKTGIAHSNNIKTVKSRIRKLKERLKGKTLNGKEIGEGEIEQLVPGLDELESEIEDYEGTVKLGLSKEDAKERRDEIREKWETLYGTDYSLETDESLEKATKPKPKAKPKAEAEIVLEPGESNAPEAFEEGQEAARKQAQTQVDKGNVGITSQVIEGVRERTDGPLSPEDVNLGEEAGGGFFTQNDNTSSGKLLDAEVNAYNTIANSKATTLAELKKEGIVSGGHSGIGYATSGKGKNVVYHITKDAVFIGEGGKTVEEALSNAKKRSAERIGAVLAKGGTVSAAGSGGKVTTRIAVLHSNDGKVVALGVHMTQSGKPMVKNLKGTTAKSMPLSELITKHGYIPVGSIRTVAGTKGFAEVYESRKDFDEKIGDNISELKKAEAEVAPLAEGVQEIGSAQTVPLQEGDQPIVRTAPRRAPRPSQEKVNTAFSNIADAARTAGIDIKIVKGELANVEKKATAYMTLEDGRVVATLAMESVNNPTQNNTLDLLHEINHVVFDQLDPAVQKALNNAIRAVSDEALGIEGSAFMFDSSFSDEVPNELVQEERLVEAVARKMEEEGFDPATSKGLVGSLVRIWKNISFAAKMAWQKMLHGPNALSPTMAQEFFRLQVEAFLTGNSVPRIINYLGNPNTTVLEDVRHLTSDFSSVFISRNGVVEVEPVTPDTVEGLRFNLKYAGTTRYSPGGTERTNVQQARRAAATNNAVLQSLRNAYAAFTSSGANRNPAGELLISEEAFINRMLGKRGPTEILEEIEKETDPVVASTTLKDLDEIEDRPRAALDADKFLQRVHEKLKKVYHTAKDKLNPDSSSSLSARRSKIYIALEELRNKYLNLSHISSKLLEGYQANLKKYNSNPKDRRTRIRSVLDSIDRELAYSKIAASEFQRQPTPEELDRFYKMVEAGVDFTESWDNIQKKILHLATAYVPTDTRSKIIMAKFMVMAHDNPVAVEMLTLRGENPDHRRRFDGVLRMALKNDRNSVERALKAFKVEFSEEGKVMSGDFARFNRKIEKLLEKVREYKDRYSHIDLEINQAREAIAMFETTRNTFAEERAIVERLYDKELSFDGTQWEPVHKAEYMVPASPEQGLEDVLKNKQQLDLSKQVDLGLIEKHITAMTAWLKNQPVNKRGAVWKTMKRQVDKLVTLPADQAQREVSHSWIMRALGDYATKLELIGSAQARKLQQAFRSLSRNINSYGGENAKRIGREWALALDNLRIAFKKNGNRQVREDILDLYYSRAFHWFDANREILNENPGEKGQRLLLNGYKKHWKGDGKTDPAFVDAVWPQFEKLILATRKASNHINNIRKELGLSVKDEFGEYSFFRESIGDSLTTTMRKPSSAVPSVFKLLENVGWNVKKTLESKGEIKEKYLEEGQAAFLSYVDKLFGAPKVMMDFVGPLARKSGMGLLSSPTETGLTRPVPQSMLTQAYEENQTDFIGMLESLADNLGITEAEARADFISEAITDFQGVFRQIRGSQERNNGSAIGTNAAMPPHIMMDARKTTNWPEEWVEYATFGERNMHQYAKHLSVESAFGRDMGMLNKDIDRLEGELSDDVNLSKEIDRELRAEGHNTTSRFFTSAYNKAFAEKAKAAGRPAKTLKQADQRVQLLAGVKKNINNWLAAESGTPMEYYAFNDFMRTLAGFTVQGYGTALIDTISIVEQPFRKLGLGKAAFSHVLKNVGNSVGIGTGSLFQIFNKTIGFNAEKMQLLREFGLDDSTASLEGNFFSRIRDNYRSTLSDEFVGSNMLTRGVEYASRAGRAVLGTGAGKSEEGKGSFPALRIATPFTQLAKQSAMASTMSTWSQFQALVLKAAKLIENNSKYAEILRNEGVLFNDAVLKKHGLSLKKLIKELGYGRSFIVLDDTRAFLHMSESLQRNGFTLERVAANYLTRREADSKADPIGDKNLYRMLANLAISETMLETDLTTRPSGMTSSSLGQFAMPLLGWSISKTNDVVKELREPGGERSMRGAYFSMMSLLAIAPVWMWYGAMRDWFDEEIVGKKSGLQKGKGFLGAPSLEQITDDPVDAAQIALERLDRVGAFGIAGEAAVYGMGQFGGGVRDFGVDSRVFGINTFGNFTGSLIKWGRQDFTGTYQSVARPVIQSLGGSGFLQTLQVANNLTGKILGDGGPGFDISAKLPKDIPIIGGVDLLPLAQDYWINHRIGVQNYIRGAARNLNLDVRTLDGMRGTPSKLKAHIGQMVLAAYAKDHYGFLEAKREARAAAKEVDRKGYEKRVLQAFMAYHPLKQPFKSSPTQREVQKIYNTIEESSGADARKAVEDAVEAYNKAIWRLGGKAYEGKQESSGAKSTFRKRPYMSRPQKPDYRAAAATMNP